MVELGMGLSTRTLSFLFSIRMLDLLHEKDARPYCVTSASLYLPQSTNMLLIFWETNWRIHRLLCTWLRKGEIMCRPSLSDYLPFLCFTNFKHDHWSRIRWKKNLYNKTLLIQESPNSLREQSTHDNQSRHY